MKIAAIGFTRQGAQLVATIQQLYAEQGIQCHGYVKEPLHEELGLLPVAGSISKWTEKIFSTVDGIVFVGATGIAVRAIAPFLRSKDTDPAVVVIDECHHHVISLLSGHIGGANLLTMQLATMLKARPVITTATDVRDQFAVDVWAKEQGLHIIERDNIKVVSAAILDGEKVGISTVFPIQGQLPTQIIQQEQTRVGIVIGLDIEYAPYEVTLHLVPRIAVIGIGCRKAVPYQQIQEQTLEVLQRYGISLNSVKAVCSIDLKQQENGLLQLCQQYHWPFQVYSAQQLAQVKGEFRSSEFVQSITGVDNVCERAALRGTNEGVLVIPKQAQQGITIAVAIEKGFQVKF